MAWNLIYPSGMGCKGNEQQDKLDALDDLILSGVKSVSSDAESVTNHSVKDLLKIKAQYQRQDARAVACGKVQPQIYYPTQRHIAT